MVTIVVVFMADVSVVMYSCSVIKTVVVSMFQNVCSGRNGSGDFRKTDHQTISARRGNTDIPAGWFIITGVTPNFS